MWSKIKSILSESALLIVVAFSIGWISAMLLRVHGSLTLSDVGTFIRCVARYVAEVGGAIYAIDKFSDAAKPQENKVDNPDG